MAGETRLIVARVARVLVWFIYAVVVVALVLLTLAFFLRLFGASTEAEFTQWVYRSVSRIMEPFRGMFPSQELDGESVLDFSLLFAMIIYSILALALHSLVEWLSYRVRRLGVAAAGSVSGPVMVMAPPPGTAMVTSPQSGAGPSPYGNPTRP